MPRTTLEGRRCERCEHVWFPRAGREPTICPKCKSKLWAVPLPPEKGSKTKNPRKPPALEGWRCLRCEHEWAPRDSAKPKECPGCKSFYWDTPRMRKRRNP